MFFVQRYIFFVFVVPLSPKSETSDNGCGLPLSEVSDFGQQETKKSSKKLGAFKIIMFSISF